jgi:hypothetical protein
MVGGHIQTEDEMRRRERRQVEVGADDERLAREVLASVRRAWRADTARALTDRRLLEACSLPDNEPVAFEPVSLNEDGIPEEARRALALWTRYRIVCLELLGSGRTGEA